MHVKSSNLISTFLISLLKVRRAQKERGSFSLTNLLSAQFIAQIEARPPHFVPAILQKGLWCAYN